jgi:hypothetical protein
LKKCREILPSMIEANTITKILKVDILKYVRRQL